MRRMLTAAVVVAVATSCGGRDVAPAPTRTTSTSPVHDAVVEVFSYGEMDEVLWWDAVPERALVVAARANDAGSARIVGIDAQGATTVLADGVAAAASHAISPDGTTLVVAEPEAGRGWVLWAVPTAGGDPVVLTRSGDRLSVGGVSASGTVVYRTMGERPALHARGLEGGGALTLLRTPWGDVDPVMGPPTLVGDVAVYATDDEANGVRLWSVRLDKPGRSLLPGPEGLEVVWQITAADDGRHVLVQARVKGLSSERALYSLWADGRGPAVLLDEGGAHGVRDVRLDGDDVVYRVGSEWYSAALSGTRTVRLYETDLGVAGFAGVETVAAVPDGSLLFTSAVESGDRELYHFDPGTDAVTRVNGDLATHPGVLGKDGVDWVLDYRILGDGHHVAYTSGLAGASTAVPYRLYIAPLP